MCGRYDFSTISSPDGVWLASVSEEDCGALDSFHSSVQLTRRKRETFFNPFASRVRPTTVLSIGHDPRMLELGWQEAKVLVIRIQTTRATPRSSVANLQWTTFRSSAFLTSQITADRCADAACQEMVLVKDACWSRSLA